MAAASGHACGITRQTASFECKILWNILIQSWWDRIELDDFCGYSVHRGKNVEHSNRPLQLGGTHHISSVGHFVDYGFDRPMHGVFSKEYLTYQDAWMHL